MINWLFYLIPIIFIVAIIMMIGIFYTMLNPKARGKMMSKQIKATKEMLEESVDDIEDIKNIIKR